MCSNNCYLVWVSWETSHLKYSLLRTNLSHVLLRRTLYVRVVLEFSCDSGTTVQERRSDPPQLCASSPHFHSATPMRSLDEEKRSHYITLTSPKHTLNEKRFCNQRGSFSAPAFLVCFCPVSRTGDLLYPTNRDWPLHWHIYATFTFYRQQISHITQISPWSIYTAFCAHVKSAQKVKLHQPGKTSLLCRSKSEIRPGLWVFCTAGSKLPASRRTHAFFLCPGCQTPGLDSASPAPACDLISNSPLAPPSYFTSIGRKIRLLLDSNQ